MRKSPGGCCRRLVFTCVRRPLPRCMVKLPNRCGASKENVMEKDRNPLTVREQPKWMLLPNGKMWKMVDGRIEGTVVVAEYEAAESLNHRLDMISDAATGFSATLDDFGYEYLGAGLVRFWGTVSAILVGEDEDSEGAKEVDPLSKEFCLQLMKQYRMSEVEAKHARWSLNCVYDEECIVRLANGREIRTQALPSEASYVRVCVDGLECGYWGKDAWQAQGEDAMGAIIGAMKREMTAAPGRVEDAKC